MKRKTHTGWLSVLLNAFEQKGGNVSLLLEAANLPETLLRSEIDITQDQITQLWDIASELTNNPLFGLEAGSAVKANALGPLSYALMSCETLGKSFQLLIEYQHVIADALDFSINKHDNMTELVFNNIGDSIPASYHAIDAAMASFCRFYSWLLTHSLPLKSIHLMRQSPQNLKTYLSYFKCKVRLNQTNNSLWFRNDALDIALPTADKTVTELLRLTLSNMAKARLQGDFQNAVADVMRNNISQDNFGMALIASKLFISQSTLQRRLREENLTFQQLLDKTREHLAIALLRQTRLSENQISEQIGFSSASGFSRAFKKWTGKSPKTYRT